MKTIKKSMFKRSNFTFNRVAVALFALLLSSCECDELPRPIVDICPDGEPCQNAPTPDSCNPDIYVTAVDVICGVGVWGGTWLQLDNNTLLQPWLSNNTEALQVNGKYKVSFVPVTRDGLYDTVINCQAVLPSSTAVRINCIEPMTPDSCNPDIYVTAVDVICGVGVWGGTWLQLDNSTLLQPWLSNNTVPLQANGKYKVSFVPVIRDGLYDTVITCQAVVPSSTAVRINCIEPVIAPH